MQRSFRNDNKQVRSTCKCRWKESFAAFCGVNRNSAQKCLWKRDVHAERLRDGTARAFVHLLPDGFHAARLHLLSRVIKVKGCAHSLALRWLPCIASGRLELPRTFVPAGAIKLNPRLRRLHLKPPRTHWYRDQAQLLSRDRRLSV